MWDCKTSKMSSIPACRAQRLRLIRIGGLRESKATHVPSVAAVSIPTPFVGAHRGPLRHKCVTYVSGMNRNPCVRVGPRVALKREHRRGRAHRRCTPRIARAERRGFAHRLRAGARRVGGRARQVGRAELARALIAAVTVYVCARVAERHAADNETIGVSARSASRGHVLLCERYASRAVSRMACS
jgi:hypothetical protein